MSSPSNGYRKKLFLTALAGGVTLLFLLPGARVALPTSPPAKAKLLSEAKAFDCPACHGGQKMLKAEHKPVTGQSLNDCRQCHGKDAKTLRAKLSLSHLHQLSGVGCKDCHQDPQKAQALATKDCLACHQSPEKLAQATAKMEYNPHNSPHYGTTVDCNLCHHLHQKSENMCSQCHDWHLAVP